MKNRRRLYISWVGLRGAVPIVFATYPLIAGIEKAEMIFNIVFFISVTSVLIQGTTLSLVAKWLHVALPEKVKPMGATDMLLSDQPKTLMQEININENSAVIGKKIVDLGFPKNAIITMIKRDDKYITPNGSTVINLNDSLIILYDKPEGLEKIKESLFIN
jgi:cell volume regulation protein A